MRKKKLLTSEFLLQSKILDHKIFFVKAFWAQSWYLGYQAWVDFQFKSFAARAKANTGIVHTAMKQLKERSQERQRHMSTASPESGKDPDLFILHQSKCSLARE